MALRSLTCSVQPELYDEYKASLPDGQSVNSHLKMLVVAWMARETSPLAVLTGNAPLEYQQEPHVAQWVPSDEFQAAHPVPDRDVPQGTSFPEGDWEGGRVGDPGCLHPKAYQVREGHSVRCRVCTKVLTVA